MVLEDGPETSSITWELLEMSVLSPTESDTWWGGVSGLCAYQAFQVILKQAQSLRTLRKVSTGHLGRINPILALWWPLSWLPRNTHHSALGVGPEHQLPV